LAKADFGYELATYGKAARRDARNVGFIRLREPFLKILGNEDAGKDTLIVAKP